MSNRYCLDPDVVIRANATLLCTLPGDNVLDRGKLEGALANPLQTFGSDYLYASPIERAAALLAGVCKAHAFIDANKRTAWLTTVSYMQETGFNLQQVPPIAAADFVVEVATQGGRDLAPISRQLAQWLC